MVCTYIGYLGICADMLGYFHVNFVIHFKYINFKFYYMLQINQSIWNTITIALIKPVLNTIITAFCYNPICESNKDSQQHFCFHNTTES